MCVALLCLTEKHTHPGVRVLATLLAILQFQDASHHSPGCRSLFWYPTSCSAETSASCAATSG
jgi:hypothetical protein